jgi:hypothetical protein
VITVSPGMAAAWCFAADEPGGPVIVQDIHEYDLRTLQPPVGPVIAGWARKYAGNGHFSVGFTGCGDCLVGTNPWSIGRHRAPQNPVCGVRGERL